MDVKTIVKNYLEENGFDGLFQPGECACLNSELCPCEGYGIETCEAGYLQPENPHSEFDWEIGPKKKKGGQG